METNLDIFDSEGDVILVLRNFSPTFAKWDANPFLSDAVPPAESFVDEPEPPFAEEPEPPFAEDPPFAEEPDHEAPSVDINGLSIAEQPESSEHKSTTVEDECAAYPDVEMRVSSRHLILASPYFRRMFNGDWKESNTLQIHKVFRMEVGEQWDPSAMRILMDIIHCRTRKVPKLISLEMLAKIAVLVDYYECLEVVELYSTIWIEGLKQSIPLTYSRETMLWMCISWIFGEPVLFEAATSVVVKYSQGPIQTMELPIPEQFISNLESRREDAIQQAITALHKLLRKFRSGRYSCSFACSSMLLGALTKHMNDQGLLSTELAAPFFGISIAGLADSIRSMHTPEWCPVNDKHRRTYCQPHDCKLEPRLGPMIEILKQDMEGLTLEQCLPTPQKG